MPFNNSTFITVTKTLCSYEAGTLVPWSPRDTVLLSSKCYPPPCILLRCFIYFHNCIHLRQVFRSIMIPSWKYVKYLLTYISHIATACITRPRGLLRPQWWKWILGLWNEGHGMIILISCNSPGACGHFAFDHCGYISSTQAPPEQTDCLKHDQFLCPPLHICQPHITIFPMFCLTPEKSGNRQILEILAQVPHIKIKHTCQPQF